MKKYPDVTAILARKAAGRKALSRLPVEKKMEIAQRLRDAARLAPGHAKPSGKTAGDKERQKG